MWASVFEIEAVWAHAEQGGSYEDEDQERICWALGSSHVGRTLQQILAGMGGVWHPTLARACVSDQAWAAEGMLSRGDIDGGGALGYWQH
jgi:hypothetical protein